MSGEAFSAENLNEDAAPDQGLASGSFVGLVLTQFLGAFNDNLFRWLAVPIAQPILGDVKAIALGGLCLTIPYLLFAPAAGWLADRFSKRAVIVSCKVAEIVIVSLGVLTMVYGSLWALFATVFLLGSQAALFGPAKFGSIPEILPVKLLSKGNGVMGMISIAAIGLGTIAGFALFDATRPVLGSGDWSQFWPAGAALVGIAIAGWASSLLIQTAPAADPERTVSLNPLREVLPALRLLKADRRLLWTTLGIAYFYFLASLSQLNIDPFGASVLHLQKTEIGLLMAILITGVGAGSLLAGLWSDGKVELGIVPYGALGISVSALLVFVMGWLFDPLSPAWGQLVFWGACLGLFGLGTGAGLYDVPLEAYLQYRSDRKTRGTVLAGSFFLSYLLIVISCGVFYLLSDLGGLSANVIFLITGIMTIPVMLLALRLLPDWAFRFTMWLGTRVMYRVRVFGRENLPETGPGLIVCNHVSFVDGVLMCVSNHRFVRFLVYSDFTEMFWLRDFGRIMRVIPIRTTDGPKSLVKSLATAREAIQQGELVCIFAEGGLTRTGQIQPFQRGMLKIVQGTNAPVIPAYLQGLWGSIFSWRGGKVFWKVPSQWPYPVDLHFGKPIFSPSDPGLVRQAVERMGAEAAAMDPQRSKLIPARQLIRHCKASKNQPKLTDSTKVDLTGGKLLAAALAFRRVLRRTVLQPGEREVGVLLPPSSAGCIANAALALNRNVAVNLNYTLSDDVLNYCVQKAGIKHILTSRSFLEKKPFEVRGAEFVFFEDLKQQISGMDRAIAGAEAYGLPAFALERLLGLNRLSPDDTLTIVFTSGSTGEPKGVVLSHANIASNVQAIDLLLNLKEKDGIVGVLPFFHSFGYTACMWLPMCYKVRGIYHFNPLDARVVGRMCQEHKATILMATPTFLKMYLKRCEKEQFETIDLIVVGAEKLPVDLAEQFQAKFGVLPTEGYGTTELSPVAAVNIPDHRSKDMFQQGTKLGTVGRPLPGVTAMVVNPDTREDLGINKEGLLLIKGPNVMQGYLDEPEKTKQVIDHGWYNTGDFALIDTDGFVTITGRQSRFSKIAGEMVPHIHIEQELLKICEPPDASEEKITLAVTSVPDADRGERLIVLYTQLCLPVEEVLKRLAATGLPKLWLPAANSFIAVSEIPILGTGKLDLKGIKDLAQRAALGRAAS